MQTIGTKHSAVFIATVVLLVSGTVLLLVFCLRHLDWINAEQYSSPSNWAKDPDIVQFMTSPGRWVDPQTARQLQVAETCRKLDPPPPNMTRTYKHILVDENTKTLYCFIPKAGCTSWKFVFLNSTRRNLTTKEGASEEDGAQYRSYRYVHFADDLKSLRHFTQEERDHRLKTYFKFIVVRHPLQRLVSAYRDKFVKRQKEFLDQALRMRVLFRSRVSESREYVTFEEFIRYVLLTGSSQPPRQDIHWATYQELCQPCFVKYDYIGRMETLDLDSEIILKIMGLKHKFPLLHVQSQSSTFDHFQLLRKKFFDRAVEFYAIDMDMFGYNSTGYGL